MLKTWSTSKGDSYLGNKCLIIIVPVHLCIVSLGAASPLAAESSLKLLHEGRRALPSIYPAYVCDLPQLERAIYERYSRKYSWFFVTKVVAATLDG